MLVYEYKLRLAPSQRIAIDAAIRTTQFVRNKALRLWMDRRSVGRAELQALCAELAEEHPFAAQLNSMARQAAADRAWQAIARFYKHCREKKRGKKGYPRFQKDNRSVEYKTSGWKLASDGRRIAFTDEHGIGTVRLIGTRAIETFPVGQIKRVRLLKRADGYYVQFAVQADRQLLHAPTGTQVGIDVGLKVFLMDSGGASVANPRFLRKAEWTLKRLHRRVSRKQKGSQNRKKAVRRLAKSISDAAWGVFLGWLRYYGQLASVAVVAIPPAFTTQDCSGLLPDGTRCQMRVRKSLSIRTHRCPRCGLVLDRDENGARNILAAGQALMAAS